jgi:hypothetical protein
MGRPKRTSRQLHRSRGSRVKAEHLSTHEVSGSKPDVPLLDLQLEVLLTMLRRFSETGSPTGDPKDATPFFGVRRPLMGAAA